MQICDVFVLAVTLVPHYKMQNEWPKNMPLMGPLSFYMLLLMILLFSVLRLGVMEKFNLRNIGKHLHLDKKF